jgi:SlyX protein
METPDPIDRRLTELEIKASFNEDLLEQLNAQVFRQQEQMAALLREVQALRERSAEQPPARLRDLRDDIPPHY